MTYTKLSKSLISCWLVATLFTFATVLAIDLKAGQKQAVLMTDAAQPIQVSSNNPEFEIKLPCNTSGGYQWFLFGQNSHLYSVIRQHSFQAAPEDKIAGGGYETWTFTVHGDAFNFPQVAQLHFVYGKPGSLSSRDLAEQQQKVFTVVLTK